MKAALVFSLVALLGFVLLSLAVLTPQRPGVIVGATIQVTGTALAGLAAYLLWRKRHEADRVREQDRKIGRQRRMLVALRSELALNLESYAGMFAPHAAQAALDRAIAQMQAAQDSEHSMLMAVTVSENVVFDSLKDEVADLPDRTIGPVIRFYYYDANIIETLRGFTSGNFENLSNARKEAALRSFYNLGTETLASGFVAYDEINATLSDDPIQFGFEEDVVRADIKAYLMEDPQIILNNPKGTHAPKAPNAGVKR